MISTCSETKSLTSISNAKKMMCNLQTDGVKFACLTQIHDFSKDQTVTRKNQDLAYTTVLKINSLECREKILEFKMLIDSYISTHIMKGCNKFGKHHLYKVIPTKDLIESMAKVFGHHWNFEVVNEEVKYPIIRKKLNILVEVSIKINLLDNNSWSVLGGLSNRIFDNYNIDKLHDYIGEVEEEAIDDGLRRAILNLLIENNNYVVS
ncbi:hypothetical protein TPHA_0B02300 [Tetrapisispora phaffii CBS 4417]|uniref:Uncharacterized protein n=1 Tax=Tetrapisispora phaffii (strain ATCC 24235 / CBS 4417 / NBRC 1672 / NRRL Y-8282 / UCD 70-5) TaxID=1071381 RepID=G8BPH1_TETPH|nr:hypothetical protein TPHA_0B02300 [Tetrapisispora phaffii CBS 4417]CCE61902.1 hypothetical protein TPHA_0B02300 [Tetrapisispora phaffii CBS 4417]